MGHKYIVKFICKTAGLFLETIMETGENSTFVEDYFQRWMNTHLVHLRVLAAERCLCNCVKKSTVPRFLVMKKCITW